MIDQPDRLREVAWNELFRWLVLLRSVRVALMARVLVLGAMGLIATTLGWRVINWTFSTSDDPVLQGDVNDRGERDKGWHETANNWLWNKSPEFSIVSTARSADELFAAAAEGLKESPVTLWLYLTRPFINLFDSKLTPTGFLCLLLCGVWELFVWGLFGGAIARIAALKLTRDEAPDLLAALRHSSGKLLSYSMAPLLAIAGAAVFGIQLAILGVIMRLSFFAVLAGFMWPFVLLLGLLMAILLIGALAGWPLMWATVSVEGTDAFDALSRSYAYTYQRPLRLVWYVLIVAVLAAVSMFIVKLFATSAIALGSWSVSWGLDDDTYRAIVSPRPAARQEEVATGVPPLELAPPANAADSSPDAVSPSPTELGGLAWLAKNAIDFWKSLLGALAAGYQAGFLWVAAVGVYLLLRKDVDGAEMDEVYVDEEPDYGMPPLADDAASGVPEVQGSDAAYPGNTTTAPS